MQFCPLTAFLQGAEPGGRRSRIYIFTTIVSVLRLWASDAKILLPVPRLDLSVLIL